MNRNYLIKVFGGSAIFLSVVVLTVFLFKHKSQEATAVPMTTKVPPETVEPVTGRPTIPPAPTPIAVSEIGSGIMRPQQQFSDFGQFKMQILKGDAQALPKQLQEAMRAAKERQDAAFRSEAAAKAELDNLAACARNSGNAAMPKLPADVQRQLPKEMKEQLSQLSLLAAAECIVTAQQLTETFPALRDDYQNKIVANANPKAMQMASKSRAQKK